MDELDLMYANDKQLLIKQAYNRLVFSDDEKLKKEYLVEGLLVNDANHADEGKKVLNEALIQELKGHKKSEIALKQLVTMITETFEENDQVMVEEGVTRGRRRDE